jgi:hypothetical protein
LPSVVEASDDGDGVAESNTGGVIDIVVSPSKRLGRKFSGRIFGTSAGGRNSNSTGCSIDKERFSVPEAIMSATTSAACTAMTAMSVT